MLAINNRLGYRPLVTQWSCLTDLTSAAPEPSS